MSLRSPNSHEGQEAAAAEELVPNLGLNLVLCCSLLLAAGHEDGCSGCWYQMQKAQEAEGRGSGLGWNPKTDYQLPTHPHGNSLPPPAGLPWAVETAPK